MRPARRGHALLVTLIVLALIASCVAVLAAHYGFRVRLAAQEHRRIHLQAMTDAAIAESLANLAESSSWAGVAERPFAGGTIRSRVEALPSNRRQILASATYRGWARTVRVRVRLLTAGLEVESWSPVPPTNP